MTLRLAAVPRTLTCLALGALSAPLAYLGQAQTQMTGIAGLCVAFAVLFMPAFAPAAHKAPLKRVAPRRSVLDSGWSRTRRARPKTRPTYRIR